MKTNTEFSFWQEHNTSLEGSPRRDTGDEVSILVVDDSPVVRKYVTKSLGADYDFVEAGSFLEASLFLTRRSFSLVITDVVLPDISGISLLRTVVSAHPETRVIVITGEGLEKGGSVAVEEGAVCFLTKPFKPEALRRAVALALASRIEEAAASEAAGF